MKKIEVTKEQMVEAVKANGKEPWGVLGIKRRTWFDIIKRAGLTMSALNGANVSADSANVSADSANVSADSANVSADSANVSADSANVSADSANVSADSANVSADSANVSADSANVSADSANVSADSANVSTRTIRPVPQWEPNVPNEANSVGRGGVRYRYTDTEKYNEFVKEDAFRIMEREVKNEITHKPAEREIKPEIPEELLQYDQIDVPYDVWIKYIDESKGEHWGTFVMKYGRWLEPKKHNNKEEVEKRASEKLGLGYFEKYVGKGGIYNPSRDSYILNGEENFF